MEIRVLKYFLAVAREGSITKAANSLHLTQPTLSRQLQDLEKELGQKLLTRGKYKVSLTPEGMLLRKRAEEIVEMVDKTASEFQSIKEVISGDIYIGCGETDSMKYLADIMKEFQTDYPDVKFHIYSGNAEDVIEKLDKGLLDFGVLIQPIDLSKYDNISFPEKDTWGVVMRKDSPLAQKEVIKVEDLVNVPILVSRQMSPKYSKESGFLDWFGDKFDDLKIAATYNLFYNAAIMVKAGMGSAVTLDKLANTSKESELCFRALSPKLESGLDIVWGKYQIFSPAAKLFLAKLNDRFKQKTNFTICKEKNLNCVLIETKQQNIQRIIDLIDQAKTK